MSSSLTSVKPDRIRSSTSNLLFILFCVLQVSARDRLYRDLTADYNAKLNPEPTDLTVALTALSVTYDKAAGELATAVWEFHSWKDARLSWNPEDYDGVKSLRIPSSEIWTPDTKLYNSVGYDRDSDCHAVVSSDGAVIWIPLARYRTLAQESNDGEVRSSFKIGSWTYATDEVDLKKREEGLDLSYFDPASPYVVSSSASKIDAIVYDDKHYAYLVIDFTVKSR